MVRSRFWSCFHNISDAELEQGIEELDREHKSGQELVFNDKVIFIIGHVLGAADRAYCKDQAMLKAVQAYSENGFASPIHLASDDATFEMLVQVKKLLADVQDKSIVGQHAWSALRFKSHLYLPWLHHFIFENMKLKALACMLLRTPDVVVWNTEWCVRQHSEPVHVAWHQDSAASGFGHKDGVTIWLAISDVRKASGPTLFKRASQALGELPHYEVSDAKAGIPLAIPEPGHSEFEKLLTAEQRTWSTLEQASTPLAPGEASAHGASTVYASQGNEAETDRIGLSIQLLRAECAKEGHKHRVSMLCGDETKVKCFELEDKEVTEEFGAGELAQWQLSMNKEKDASMEQAAKRRKHRST